MTQKFTRSELKGLIKECLIEILQEGVGETGQRPRAPMPMQESRHQDREARHESTIRRNISDKMSFLPEREKMQRPVNPRINEGIANITSDPIMQAIFSDTAANTLAEQASAERGGPTNVVANDRASMLVANSDPADLFSGASDKWASLAFGEPVNRR